MNSYYFGRRKYHAEHEQDSSAALALLAAAALSALAWTAVSTFHFRGRQVVTLGVLLIVASCAAFAAFWFFATRNRRIQERWPHPPIVVPMLQDRKAVKIASGLNSIVLGYDVHKKPWLWPDHIRVMQALLIGQSGAGKTTLLKNIITQDIHRLTGTPDHPRRIPMIVVGGKGDPDDLDELMPEIAAAGRLHQLRVLDPSRPEISARFNPFYSKNEAYQEHVNSIFESFALKKDFFSGHQATYLSDLARVLWHTGKRFNIHDVMVMALDPLVMKEQIQLARMRISATAGITTQRKLNFEMSVRNLLQSLDDRDRVPKIQGLLNELMTFLEDDLSVVTGPYNDLLTLDDVIEQDLILFVSLNTNRNSRAITALGRMLLQNMQLLVGKGYSTSQDRPETKQSIVSIVLDEFAPFAYPNFSQTLQTARGTNTAFLFSLQSVSQLLSVSRSFRDDVLSAPNTIMTMRTRDEESAKYFLNASARVKAERRTMTIEEQGLFEKEYKEMGFGSVTEVEKTRAEDFRIKNLPLGQMEILQTDHQLGTLYSHLYVRRPNRLSFPGRKPSLYLPRPTNGTTAEGANLRFKSPEGVQRFSRIRGTKQLADLVMKS